MSCLKIKRRQTEKETMKQKRELIGQWSLDILSCEDEVHHYRDHVGLRTPLCRCHEDTCILYSLYLNAIWKRNVIWECMYVGTGEYHKQERLNKDSGYLQEQKRSCDQERIHELFLG